MRPKSSSPLTLGCTCTCLGSSVLRTYGDTSVLLQPAHYECTSKLTEGKEEYVLECVDTCQESYDMRIRKVASFGNLPPSIG